MGVFNFWQQEQLTWTCRAGATPACGLQADGDRASPQAPCSNPPQPRCVQCCIDPGNAEWTAEARGRQKVITRMENTIWKCWMQPRPRLRVEKYTSLILVITAPAFHRGVTIPILIGWETIVLHPYCMEQPPDNSPWITLKNGFSPYKGFPVWFKGVLFFKVFSFPTLQMGYETVLNCITTTTQLPTSVSGVWIQNK